MTKKQFRAERFDSDTDEQILEEARRRFKIVEEAESEVREEMLTDLKFRWADQWESDVWEKRRQKGRPCLTINRIPQFVQQITNDQRQNRPAIHVNPVEDSDIEGAEIRQGLIRSIEVASDAGTAYDIANTAQVIMGRGWVRVTTEYCDDESDFQDIRIKPIRNAFSVYPDPSCQEVDYSDATYMFVVQDMQKDSFRAEWGESELCNVNDWTTYGNTALDWVSKDGVRVAEYWRVVAKKRTRYTLMDGTQVYKDEIEGAIPKEFIASERQRVEKQVQQFIINGVEILDRKLVPEKWIPIVPAIGEECEVDGERYIAGAVRDARESQRLFNYAMTNLVETVALAPRAPFTIAEGQIEGYATMWENANTENYGALIYKPVAVGGQYVPPPQRNQAEPPIQAINQMIGLMDNNLKATFGIYDASLGARGNETSGKAILARQRESDVANFHFNDNFARTVRHVGRIVLSWIPYYYDAARIVRITMPDGSTEDVAVNQPTMYKGVEKVLDLTSGRYDVAISVGPSYQTKRQEASEALLQLAQAAPILMQRAPHLIVKNLDIPGAAEIAEVLTPPDLKQDNKEIPPQARMAIDQLTDQVESLQEFSQSLFQKIQTKEIETASHEKIELEKIQVQREELQAKIDLEMAKLGSAESMAELNKQVDVIKSEIARMQAAEEAEINRQFQREQAAAQASAAQQQPTISA